MQKKSEEENQNITEAKIDDLFLLVSHHQIEWQRRRKAFECCAHEDNSSYREGMEMEKK